MIMNLKELLPIQAEVNEEVRKRNGVENTLEDYILAFNVELFEYFNAVGTWKWWKLNHKIDREKILDELADCFAFFLSVVEISERDGLVETAEEDIVAAYEKDLSVSTQNLYSFGLDRKAEHVINDLIKVVGVDNESGQPISIIHRFAIAIYIAQLLFKGITWEEMVNAYKKKSGVNIQRQEENY